LPLLTVKTSELNKLLRAVIAESDRMPLSEAEQRLYRALHLAVMAYEDELRLGPPAPERRCMICERYLSECTC
jgi:hypothetical protein